MIEIECDGLLFDSDGVLVDSHEVVETAWRQLAAEFSLDEDRLLATLAGMRPVDLLGGYLTGDALDEAVARLEDIEIALAGSVSALPGALDLLTALDGEGWAVVTSATRKLAEIRWRSAGLPLPPESVTADEVGKGKPDPEPYLRAALLIGEDPKECVVLEDSASGGLAGRVAGAAVVAVGDQEWPIDPVARVPDLSSVEVRRGSGRMVLAIDS